MQIKQSTKEQFDKGTYARSTSDLLGRVSLIRKNLLENSSFEYDQNPVDTATPPDNIAWAWNTYRPGGLIDTFVPLLDTSIATQGSKSQKITFTSVSGKEFFFGQNVNVSENTYYSLSADVMIDNPVNFSAFLKVEFRKADDSYISEFSSKYSSPTSFTRLYLTFKTPSLTDRVRLWVILHPNAGVALPITGSIWIDSAQFEIGNVATEYIEKYGSKYGEYTSEPIYIPEKNSHKLEITSSIPDDTNLKIQFRSANSLESLKTAQWYGQKSKTDYYQRITTIPVELIQDPGFETQNPTNPKRPDKWGTWNIGSKTTTQKYSYPEPGRNGGSSVAIEYPVFEQGNAALWVQNVTINTNKKYKLSGWIKTQNVSAGVSIHADFKSSSGSVISYSSILSPNKYIGNLKGWSYFEGIVTPPSTATYATIVLELQNTTGKVWFDDISLEEATNISKEWSINQINRNDSYIQYKIIFTTNNTYYSPLIYDVRIDYGLATPEIHDIELSSINRGVSYSFYPGETINFKIEVVDHGGINNIKGCSINLLDNNGYSHNISLQPDIIIDNNRRYYTGSFIIPGNRSNTDYLGTWEAKINVINYDLKSFSESTFIKIRDDYKTAPRKMTIGILQSYLLKPSSQKDIDSTIAKFSPYTGVDIWKLGISWEFLEYKRGEYNTNYINAIIKIMNAASSNGAKFQLGIGQQRWPDWVNDGKWDNGSRYTDYSVNKYLTETWEYLSSQIKDHPALDSYLIVNEENWLSDNETFGNIVYIKSNNKVISNIKYIDRNISHRVTIRPNTTSPYIRTKIGNNGNHDYDYGTGSYPTGPQWFGTHESPISYTSYMYMSVRFRYSPLIFNNPGGIGEIGLFSSTEPFGDEQKLIAFERAMSISYDNGYDEFQIWEGSFSFKQPELYFPKLRIFRDMLLARPRLSRFNVRIVNDVPGDSLIQHQPPWLIPYYINVANEQYYHLIRKLDEGGYSWFHTNTKAEPLQPKIYDATILMSEIKGKTEASQDILIENRLKSVIPVERIKTWSLTPGEPIESLCPIPIAVGNINFVSNPAGAEIFIDGSDQKHATPYMITCVPVGEHSYKLTLINNSDITGSVIVKENTISQVSANFITGHLNIGSVMVGIGVTAVVIGGIIYILKEQDTKTNVSKA